MTHFMKDLQSEVCSFIHSVHGPVYPINLNIKLCLLKCKNRVAIVILLNEKSGIASQRLIGKHICICICVGTIIKRKMEVRKNSLNHT